VKDVLIANPDANVEELQALVAYFPRRGSSN